MYRLSCGLLAYAVVVSRILLDCGDIANMKHYHTSFLKLLFLALP